MDIHNEYVQAEMFEEAVGRNIHKADSKIVEHPKVEDFNYVYRADKLIENAEDKIDFLLEPVLPRHCVAMLAGPSDSNKSTFLRQFGLAIVSGYDEFVDFKLYSKYRSVIYISTEDDEIITGVFLKKQAAGLLPENIRNLRFIFESNDLVRRLDECLEQQKADVAIIDPFSNCFKGDINNLISVRSFIEPLQQLSRKHQCVILLLHHLNKSNEALIPNKRALSGSHSLTDVPRVVLDFRKDKFDKSKRHLSIIKGNYVADNFKSSTYVLQFDEATMTLSNTGERVDFGNLQSNIGYSLGEQRKVYAEIDKLYKQGESIRDISIIINKPGYGKTKIAEYLKTKHNDGEQQIAD